MTNFEEDLERIEKATQEATEAVAELSRSTEVKKQNQFFSNRRGSLAAEFNDDDDIRAELSRLSLTEQLMHQELLNAIQEFGDLLSDSGDGDNDENLEEKEEVEEDEEEAYDDFHVEEEAKPSQLPWYARVLKRKPTLEQEIKMKKEMYKQSLRKLDVDYADVMDCTTQTQEHLINNHAAKTKQSKRSMMVRFRNKESLQEEIKKRKEMYKESLRRLDVGFEEAVDSHAEAQQILVQQSLEGVLKSKQKDASADDDRRRGFQSNGLKYYKESVRKVDDQQEDII